MAFAADPDFKDYAVTPVFSGPNHEPVQQEQSNPVMDSTRAKALQGKVNFAGHYILYRFGCGGGAICGEVLDAQTGDGEEDAQGNRLENRNRDRYYEFVNNEFRLLGMTDVESPSIDEE
jgi:hypothetical protein